MTHRRNSKHTIISKSIGIISFSALICTISQVSSFALTVAANVTVVPTSALNTIPSTSVGVNTAIWDGYLTEANTSILLQEDGVKALRYPGGSASDGWFWEQHLGAGDQTDFDTFMTHTSLPSGVSQIITVNYGSNAAGTGGGDPTEAANWVKHANITKGYGVKYWEIGNEVYGSWEEDLWPSADNAVSNPTFYGQEVVQYINAMKAQDPTIKVGVVLQLPGQIDYSDGSISTDVWNQAVMAQCGTKVDFVIVHWYPEYVNDSDSVLLADPSQIPGFVTGLKSLISTYSGSNASNVKIMVTETNSDAATPGKQMLSTVNALFMTDNVQSWLEQGAVNVDYWDLRNGAGNGDSSSNLFGTLQYGDEGMLSNGTSTVVNGTTYTEPAVDTPFSAYYALQMSNLVGSTGDMMVTSSSDQTHLSTHAVQRADGSLGVLLINKSSTITYNATLNLSSYKPTYNGQSYTYGPSTTVNAHSTFLVPPTLTVSLQPYTMETVILQKQPASIPSNTFAPGLQLVSLPFDFTGVDPETVISPLTPMAVWDPTTNLYYVDPNAPADSYRAGHGYWIHVPASGAMVGAASGTAPGATTSVSLSSGWNLIGDPYNVSLPESDIQVQVGSAAATSLAAAITAGTVSTTLWAYPAGASAYVSNDASAGIQPWTGYWLQANTNCTLIYNTP